MAVSNSRLEDRLAIGVALDVADGSPAEELGPEQATSGARKEGEFTHTAPP
jgi:hypothetical protein